MKPLIIGMGPSPDLRYKGKAWFPLAPASRSLSKLIFDRWASFPEVERAFDLTNLNQNCHQRTSGNRKRDYVHPSEGSVTMARLTSDGVFAQDRVIFSLGSDVANYVESRAPKSRVARLVRLPHPSILCTPWNWPAPRDGSWRAKMRKELRASIGLPFLGYDGPADVVPELIWASFAKEDWLNYAKRYDLQLSKAEWVQLIGRDIKRMSIGEAEALVAEPRFDISTESDQQISDLHDDIDDWRRSSNEGWFHSDDE
jgi:hypothetical protein